MRPPIVTVRLTIDRLPYIGVAIFPGSPWAVKTAIKKLARLNTRKGKCTRIECLSAAKPELDRQ